MGDKLKKESFNHIRKDLFSHFTNIDIEITRITKSGNNLKKIIKYIYKEHRCSYDVNLNLEQYSSTVPQYMFYSVLYAPYAIQKCFDLLRLYFTSDIKVELNNDVGLVFTNTMDSYARFVNILKHYITRKKILVHHSYIFEKVSMYTYKPIRSLLELERDIVDYYKEY